MTSRDLFQKENSCLYFAMFVFGFRASARDSETYGRTPLTLFVDRCFIPQKSPMIFRWHRNTAWNPREWISKRLTLREQTNFWEDEELTKKAREYAQSHIQSRRTGTPAAKHLQAEISHLFDNRSEKEAHILAWMVGLHMHLELEDNAQWSLPSLYTDEKLGSIFNFIYHLTNDLGSVVVLKGLSQRGHSPRLYEREEGYVHYPQYTQTMWAADVGNAMYGYVGKHLDLLPDAANIGPELLGDVIEIAYNLYFMYAALQIDVASLLGVDPTVLSGWWAPVTMIQRDAHIQSAAMLGGKGADTSRFEQVCIYISGLTQLTPKKTISAIKGRESHKGTCPVQYCHVCVAHP